MMGTCSGCEATDVEVNEAGHCAACATAPAATTAAPDAADSDGDSETEEA